MSKYELPYIKKKTKDDSYKSLFIRIEDEKIQVAIRNAIENSGLSSQKLILNMIEHCLKDAGFLK